MPDPASRPPKPPADPAGLQVRERVLARVRDAARAADALPRVRRRRRRQGLGRVSSTEASPDQQREIRALRRVFLDLGDCYRDYRRRTGAPVAPEVRDAAHRFQRDRDLASLVSVAATLDRLESLTW